MKTSGVISGIGLASGIAGAFGAGYLVAKGFSASEGSSGIEGKKPGADVVAGDRWVQRAGGGRTWPEEKARIFKLFEASPAMMVDYPMRAKAFRALGDIPLADLDTWMRELRPEPNADYDKDVNVMLREVILKELAERGGGDFIRSLAADPLADAEYDLSECVRHWIGHDPVGALEWLDGGNLPEEVREDVESYREDALGELAGQDPGEFERRLVAADSETRENVLEEYAFRRGDIENRAEILGRASRSSEGDAMALWEGLIRREVADDPERGYATLAELVISGKDRQRLDESVVISQMSEMSFHGSDKDRAEIMRGWADRNPGDEVSEGILRTIEGWLLQDFQTASKWLANQPSGSRYDKIVSLAIFNRIGRDGEDHRELAGIAVRIVDTDLRAEANRRLHEAWELSDTEAAAEWEKSLPADDRKRLSRVGRD